MKKLPNKLSELIRLSLYDLKLVEKDKRYKVDMSYFHNPGLKKCSVCLAGAVMAKSLKLSLDKDFCYSNFTDDENKKVIAINSLRLGFITSAAVELGKNLYKFEKYDRNITDYHYNKSKFKKEMLKLAKDLEKDGL